ncbi:MAG: lysylphosphatidylglycerol synthase transmembrane domain-containing protein [bacterium]
MSENNFILRRWKLILNYIIIVGLIVLIVALRKELVQTFEDLQHVNAWYLLLMIPIQVWNYYAQAKLFQSILGVLGNKLRTYSLFIISLELNLVNNVFPSGGLSGASYFATRIRSSSLTVGKATFTYVMKLAMIFFAFQILVIFGLLALALNGSVNSFVIFTASFSSGVIIFGTLLFIHIIGSQSRITTTFTFFTKALNKIISIVMRKHPEAINLERAKAVFIDFHHNYNVLKSKFRELKKPLYYGFLNNLTELLSIYVVYLAFGHWVNPGAIILAYAIANFAGVIGVLPGGIGVYEAMMVAVMVAAGIPADLSLSVTIMYRVLNTIIQLPPGYYFWHKRINFRENLSAENDG